MIREEYNISKEGMKRLLRLLERPLEESTMKTAMNRLPKESEIVEFKNLDLSFIDKT